MKLNQNKLFKKIAKSMLGGKRADDFLGNFEKSKESTMSRIAEISKGTCLEPVYKKSRRTFSVNQFMMEAAINRKITQKLPNFRKKGHFL